MTYKHQKAALRPPPVAGAAVLLLLALPPVADGAFGKACGCGDAACGNAFAGGMVKR